jgi:hypothetical protein
MWVAADFVDDEIESLEAINEKRDQWNI